METTYDQPINDRICQKNESMQFNAAHTKNGAIKGAFQTKPHQEFGLIRNTLSSDYGLELYIKLNDLSYQSICLILFLKKTSLTMLIQPHSYNTPIAELVFFSKNFFSFCNK